MESTEALYGIDARCCMESAEVLHGIDARCCMESTEGCMKRALRIVWNQCKMWYVINRGLCGMGARRCPEFSRGGVCEKSNALRVIHAMRWDD